MAANSETEVAPTDTVKPSANKFAQSASCFPQSFPVIDRNSSNASSIFTDLDSTNSLEAEQQDTLMSVLEAEESGDGCTSVTEGSESLDGAQVQRSAEADKVSPSNNLEQAAEQPRPAAPSGGEAEGSQKSSEADLPNGGVEHAHGDTAGSSSPGLRCFVASENGDPSLARSENCAAKQESQKPENPPESIDQASDNDSADEKTPSIVPNGNCLPAENGLAASASSDPAQSLRAHQMANGDSESKTSISSLSAGSEPFVPSADSSQQVTPRGQDVQAQPVTSSGRLNANAVAFVPSSGSQTSAAGEELAAATWHSPLQLQFGSLPHSLTVSPQVNPSGDAEYGQEGHAYTEGQEWHAWNGGYEYDPYEEGVYTDCNGCQFYLQEDGSWVYYGDANGAGSLWDGYEGEYPAEGYEGSGNSSRYYEDSQASGRFRRGGRTGRRGQERRRPTSWQAAVLDVLESQFQYSRESMQEMLELHEGNLEVALDMLAQLEAEMDGQLPASGQDAPELNEENFPSLSSTATSAAPQKGPKAGFAEAVKAPAAVQSSSAAPARPQARDPAAAAAVAAEPESGATEVEWKETGAAVSEAYASARSIARDHARLRNTFFQEATKAYLAGNKALAKELGAKGRAQSDLMKAAHVEASQAIYKHRNPSAGRKGKGPALVDLHGLHVKEAIAVLEDEIAAARRSRSKSNRSFPHRMSVLVGTGNHTKGIKTPARLPAAVEDWLQASQIAFSRTAPGLLELKL